MGELVEPLNDGGAASLEEKVDALRSPRTYDEQPRYIKAIETHYAWVFLADDYAYKLKKPMRMAYLDLSELAARERNCAEELRLNRRLAPDVYLEIAALTRPADGAIHVGGPGIVLDWLVKMRRLPSALMLDCATVSGTIDEQALAAVGVILARFYQTQQRIEFAPRAYLARLSSQIRTDRTELLSPDLNIEPGLVESIAEAQSSACARLEQELMQRAQQKRIVEAHGDLRPEHICLSDPPCVIDSLEFSSDLRTLDPGEELAFLGVECDRLGSAWVGEAVLQAYCVQSGDPITPELMDFYRSRRATVRAKLVAWHLRDPAVRDLANWSLQAREYLDIAHGYAMRAPSSSCQRVGKCSNRAGEQWGDRTDR